MKAIVIFVLAGLVAGPAGAFGNVGYAVNPEGEADTRAALSALGAGAVSFGQSWAFLKPETRLSLEEARRIHGGDGFSAVPSPLRADFLAGIESCAARSAGLPDRVAEHVEQSCLQLVKAVLADQWMKLAGMTAFVTIDVTQAPLDRGGAGFDVEVRGFGTQPRTKTIRAGAKHERLRQALTVTLRAFSRGLRQAPPLDALEAPPAHLRGAIGELIRHTPDNLPAQAPRAIRKQCTLPSEVDLDASPFENAISKRFEKIATGFKTRPGKTPCVLRDWTRDGSETALTGVYVRCGDVAGRTREVEGAPAEVKDELGSWVLGQIFVGACGVEQTKRFTEITLEIREVTYRPSRTIEAGMKDAFAGLSVKRWTFKRGVLTLKVSPLAKVADAEQTALGARIEGGHVELVEVDNQTGVVRLRYVAD